MALSQCSMETTTYITTGEARREMGDETEVERGRKLENMRL